MIPTLQIGAWRLRWLHLRHAWPVRWAHHPLCQRHAHETWRIGQMFVCKGCLSLASGLLVGSVLVLGFGGVWCVWALALLGPLAFAPSWPPVYHRLPRSLRNVLRMAAGVFVALCAWIVAQWPLLAWPILPTIAALWWMFRRARMTQISKRCDGCPELGAGGVCSGYAREVACVRAIEADIERRLDSQLSGFAYPPAAESTKGSKDLH